MTAVEKRSPEEYLAARVSTSTTFRSSRRSEARTNEWTIDEPRPRQALNTLAQLSIDVNLVGADRETSPPERGA